MNVQFEGGGDYIKVYKDRAFRWRWVKQSANHRKISTSGEAFATRWNARRAAIRANPGIELR